MGQFTQDIRILDLELFDAAFAVTPGTEDAAKRRFMTLFLQEDSGHRGGSANVYKATNVMGEAFAVKMLHPATSSGTASNSGASSPKRKRLRASFSSDASSAKGATPDYVTKEHVAAFYEEYRIHLAVSNLRGFPALYGFGLADGNPLLVMEWVEGTTLRDAVRERAQREPDALLPLEIVTDLGIAVLEQLERATQLDARFVHRDISPRNIMLRADRTPADEQLRTGSFDLCLVDFGSAALLANAPDPTFTQQAGVTRLGTPAYAPPEMLTVDVALPDGYRQSPAIDVYALSSVLYELYAGRKPFPIRPDSPPAYRLKTESAPEPLALREPDGGALAGAILSGLSVQQEDRPTIAQLKAALENWKRMPTQKAVGALHSAKPADASFWQPGTAGRLLSRRRFIAGGIVAVAAVLSGTIIGSKLLRQTPSPIDASRYATTQTRYAGEPLFKAFDGESNGWVFCTADGRMACKPGTSREPGALRAGLSAVYDDASQRYGYITPTDSAEGYAWFLLPAFALAADFSEDLAAALDPGTKLWGFINTAGEWAVPAQFHAAGAFSQGIAAAQDESSKLWGAIDTAGNWAIGPRFTALGMRANNGYAVAEDAQAPTAQAWGIVDADGNWASDIRFPQLRRFSNGLAPARDAQSGNWGYVNATGTWEVPATLRDARPFSEGLAAVQDAKTQLWDFIEPSGKPHANMKPRFWKLGDLHDGLAPAQASIDDDTVQFDAENPDAVAIEAGKRYGYVDATGEWQMKRLANLLDTAIGPAGI
ncbi:MAG: WG repeat-containing protein [Coriobacteriia bacterium]|nr:WG repeat-containing protein [Coriobacteriia bacterium]